MCCIAACKNRKPSFEEISKMYLDNNDGAGMIWWNKDKIAEYKKGLNLNEVRDLVEKTPLPFILHFRASSIGGKSLLLSHPFEVTEDSYLHFNGVCDQLLIQNGTYTDYDMLMTAAGVEFPDDESPVSDARGIAIILSKLKDYPEKQNAFLKKLSTVGRHGSCVTGQKFILIDSKLQQFKMAGDFTEENGIYFSNTYWKYKTIISNEYSDLWKKNTGCNLPVAKTIIPPKSKEYPLLLNPIGGLKNAFEKFSPLLGGMDFNDKKKYFQYLKASEILNGGQSVKFEELSENNVEATDDESYVVCRFCDTMLQTARVKTLTLIGYAVWEMSCVDCCNELNYSKYTNINQ